VRTSMAAVRGLVARLQDGQFSTALTFARSEKMSKSTLCKVRAAFGGSEELTPGDSSVKSMVEEIVALARSSANRRPGAGCEEESLTELTQQHEAEVGSTGARRDPEEPAATGQEENDTTTACHSADPASEKVGDSESASDSQSNPTRTQAAMQDATHTPLATTCADLATLKSAFDEMKSAFSHEMSAVSATLVRESREARDNAKRLQVKVSELTEEVKALSATLEQVRREGSERERSLTKQLQALASKIHTNSLPQSHSSSKKPPRKADDPASLHASTLGASPTTSANHTTDRTHSSERPRSWADTADAADDDRHRQSQRQREANAPSSSSRTPTHPPGDVTVHHQRVSPAASSSQQLPPITEDDSELWQLVTSTKPRGPNAAKAVLYVGNIPKELASEGNLTTFINKRMSMAEMDPRPSTTSAPLPTSPVTSVGYESRSARGRRRPYADDTSGQDHSMPARGTLTGTCTGRPLSQPHQWRVLPQVPTQDLINGNNPPLARRAQLFSPTCPRSGRCWQRPRTPHLIERETVPFL